MTEQQHVISILIALAGGIGLGVLITYLSYGDMWHVLDTVISQNLKEIEDRKKNPKLEELRKDIPQDLKDKIDTYHDIKYTRREMELMYVFGLLGRHLTVDELSVELETAQDRIDKAIAGIDRGEYGPLDDDDHYRYYNALARSDKVYEISGIV